MASEKLLRAEFAKQTAFGSAAAMAFLMPAQCDYQDMQEEVEAPIDAGTWMPTTFAAQTALYSSIKTKGAGYFEALPAFLNAGLSVATPSGANPYTYTYGIAVAAEPTPRPYTWRLGGGALGATGPLLQITDAFCQELNLAGNLNSKEVQVESVWFGAGVNDNSGAGYAASAVSAPSPLDMLKTLLSTVATADATATGGVFSGMTALACVVLDWQLKIKTGIMPLWSADSNNLTFCGYRYEQPVIEWTPTIRTTTATYAAIRGKFNSKTYQELKLELNGALTRRLTFKLTGRWVSCPSAHERSNGEVIMKPAFRAQVPAMQTTTPHFATIEVVSKLINI